MVDLKPDTVARLVNEGLTHQQIAERYGVCRLTVVQRYGLWLAQQKAASPKTAQAVQNLRRRAV